MLTFLSIVAVYLLVGLLFAAWFVLRGMHRLDPVAQEAGWRVRLLLLPGAAALWPILLHKLRAEDSA